MEVYERGISYIKLWLQVTLLLVLVFSQFLLTIRKRSNIIILPLIMELHQTEVAERLHCHGVLGPARPLMTSLTSSVLHLATVMLFEHVIHGKFYFDAVGADNISQIQMYKSDQIQHI